MEYQKYGDMQNANTLKAYRTEKCIVIASGDLYYTLYDEDWDRFINDDDVLAKTHERIASKTPDREGAALLKNELLAPLQNQEIWASGVTYFNSKLGREEESKEAGGSNFYARVYEADRPELFFKAGAHRAVGPGGKVRKRADSAWDVPEPELTLAITSSGKIIGYTIGNDMSSRSIEGENPLYLPQAKTYDGCAAVGPCILLSGEPPPGSSRIRLEVRRGNALAFEGATAIDQIKREFRELVQYLYRECSFPYGSLLMTGTGIVPDATFSLRSGDEIRISIDHIGTLVNTVA